MSIDICFPLLRLEINCLTLILTNFRQIVLEFSIILNLYMFSTDEIILQGTTENRTFKMFFFCVIIRWLIKTCKYFVLNVDWLYLFVFFLFFFIIHAYSIWWRKKRKSKEINIWKRIEHFFDDRKFIVESGNDYINF